MKVKLLKSVKPLGGERVKEGTIVEARVACDGVLEVVDQGAYLPLSPWEWEPVEEEGL